MRNFTVLAIALTTLMASATVAAGDVYQWKDANGVTQYSSTPPANGATYKVRTINNEGRTQAAVEATIDKPTQNPACVAARQNMKLLQSESVLQVDSDGDGKPDKTLTDGDRANQLELAQATIKVKCDASAATTTASVNGS